MNMRMILMSSVFLITGSLGAFCKDGISILDDGLLANVASKEKPSLAQSDDSVKKIPDGKEALPLPSSTLPQSTLNNSVELNQKGDVLILNGQKGAGQDELEDMRRYQTIFTQKQKDVDILNLDLKRAQLILERKEVESKIQDVDKRLQGTSGKSDMLNTAEGGFVNNHTVFSDIQVALILVSEDGNRAILVRKGVSYTVQEGDCILQNVIVKNITSREVTLSCEGVPEVKLAFTL